jgi:hypothetical protein
VVFGNGADVIRRPFTLSRSSAACFATSDVGRDFLSAGKSVARVVSKDSAGGVVSGNRADVIRRPFTLSGSGAANSPRVSSAEIL